MKKFVSGTAPEKIRIYLYLFFIISAFGYLWEVFLYLVLYHSFVNRGFFHGPWLPVYGAGAVILELMLQCLPARSFRFSRHSFSTHPLFQAARIFLVSAVSCSIMEYLTGFYLEWRYKIRYWDYRNFPLQLDGKICLYSFLCFGAGGLLLHRCLFPAVRKFINGLSGHTARTILTLLIILFLSDFVYSCYLPNTGDNITFPVSLHIKNQLSLSK